MKKLVLPLFFVLSLAFIVHAGITAELIRSSSSSSSTGNYTDTAARNAIRSILYNTSSIRVASKTLTNFSFYVNSLWFNSSFDTRFGLKTTTNLAEGLNLYFTTARVLTVGSANYIKVDGTSVLNRTIPFNKGLKARNITINVSTGTPPLTVSSTTKVTNLHADLLDGASVGTSGASIPLLSTANSWSADQTYANNVIFENTYSEFGKYTTGATAGMLQVWSDNNIYIGPYNDRSNALNGEIVHFRYGRGNEYPALGDAIIYNGLTRTSFEPLARTQQVLVATQVPLTVKGFTSQTADLFRINTSANEIVFKVNGTGYTTVTKQPIVDNGVATKVYVDARVNRTGFMYYGNCSGTFNITNQAAYTLSKDLCYQTINISNSNISVNGYAFFASTVIDISSNSQIRAVGQHGANASGTSGASAQASIATYVKRLGLGMTYTAGPAGQKLAGLNGVSQSSFIYWIGGKGGDGGRGGDGTSGTGGINGTRAVQFFWTWFDINPLVGNQQPNIGDAGLSGASGGGDGVNSGGGGGAGGQGSGGILIVAKKIIHKGQMKLLPGKGGNGGTPLVGSTGGGGGGGGGGCGMIMLGYDHYQGSGTLTCTPGIGGTGGSPAGLGTAGQNGLNAPNSPLLICFNFITERYEPCGTNS